MKLSKNQEYINAVTDCLIMDNEFIDHFDNDKTGLYTQHWVKYVIRAIETYNDSMKSAAQLKREDLDRRIIEAERPLKDHVKGCYKCKDRTTFSVISKCDKAYELFLNLLCLTNEIKDE